MKNSVTVVGAGLAGCEAAHRLANRGITVDLWEMRPTRLTEAHKTGLCGELVCSNSFKSSQPISAPGQLKYEMGKLGSLALEAALQTSVAAGDALAVDRDRFAELITKRIRDNPNIRLHSGEITSLPDAADGLCILATGPLTGEALSESLRKYTGQDHFYFYDAIAPIVEAESIDQSIAFPANRYGRTSRHPSVKDEASLDSGDYLNCPFTREEYETFIEALAQGQRVQPKSFEKLKHFEGCMPIEEMLDRGKDTLRFGPMKPVGLVDPRSGKEPYAAVQLRAENSSRSAFNLVGFQTKLKYGEQSRIFRLIPGLGHAEFLRLGSMHRNTFVDAPRVLNSDLSLKSARHVLLAGQITGVEGYFESAATGILAAIFAEARLNQKPIPTPELGSALGSLLFHTSNPRNPDYQPHGINFGLFQEEAFAEDFSLLKRKYPKKIPKEARREAMVIASQRAADRYAERVNKLPY
jgi:methylenetetrahydrofolate--tRNA-(uracil-5-)-methyltransferase